MLLCPDERLRESKYISPDKFSFTSDITIFDDSVAISSLRGKIHGTIITSKDIADSFRGVFDLIWKFPN